MGMYSASGGSATGKASTCKFNSSVSAVGCNSNYTVVTSRKKCKSKSPVSQLTPNLDSIVHNQPKLITDISHASSLPDDTQVSDTVVSSVIPIDNNFNEQVSSC